MENYTQEYCTPDQPGCIEKKEPNVIRYIQIRAANYGYIVNIGCQEIVIELKEKLIELLSKYILEPGKTEQEYCNKTLLV
jgi:hypothetical protein